MTRRAWMEPSEDKIGRSLDAPSGRGRASARRKASAVAAIAMAVIVSGAALLLLGGGSEQPEAMIPGSSTDYGQPPLPHPIVGYIYDAGANPVPEATVTITNVRLGLCGVVESDGTGLYQYDLANMGVAWEVGDEIFVEAEKDAVIGSAIGYVTENPFDMIDVTLGTVIPEFPMVIAPVAGMLALFFVVRISRHRDDAEA
ncbi:MAG: carboxypeptidase regulatory-like domain-containing protein [Methanobacteriota archaeon]|nr:MAG: carboxypeptidase regulatory-like domain-containing protein [Euryarchaeota archaeon]